MTRKAFIKVIRPDREVLADSIQLNKEPNFTNRVNDVPGDLYLEIPVNSENYNSGLLFNNGNTVQYYIKSEFSEPYIIYEGRIINTFLNYKTGILNCIVRHYSHDLKKIISTSDSDEVYNADTASSTITMIGASYIILKFTSDSGATFIDGFTVGMNESISNEVTYTVTLHSSLADAKADTNSLGTLCTSYVATNYYSAGVTYTTINGTAIAVSGSTDYYLKVYTDITGVSSGPTHYIRGISSGSGLSYSTNNSSWTDATFTPILRVYYMNETTQYTVNAETVTDRIKATLANFNEVASVPITYGYLTIENVTDTTSYTYTNASAYEVIKKSVETSGNNDLYWYIDTASNTFWLLKYTESATKYLNVDSVTDLVYESDSSNLVNKIYFIGKDSGGSNYYKTFEDTGSLSSYGIIAETIVDKRVTSDTAAQGIANYHFDLRSEPVETVKVVIQENQYQDIDSIEMYDIIHLIKLQGSGRVYLDIDEVDDIYADVDPARIFDRVMRVVGIQHKLNSIILELNNLSTLKMPLAVQQSQISSIAVENNPTTPS